MQISVFFFQPFIPIGAQAAEFFIPIQTVPSHAARGFGIALEHSGNKRFERLRALEHTAVFAVSAAGFRMERFHQRFDFALQRKP